VVFAKVIDQLHRIPSRGRAVEVFSQPGEGMDDLRLGDDIQIPPTGKQQTDVEERLQMPRELAGWSVYSLGDGADLPLVRSKQGEQHAVLAEGPTPQHHGIGSIDSAQPVQPILE